MTLRTANRTRTDLGCAQCKPLYSYDVLDADDVVVARLWQERDGFTGHPDSPHFATVWKAEFADGTTVTGPWSRHRSLTGDGFCSRGWALNRITAQAGQQAARPAENDDESGGAGGGSGGAARGG